MRAKCSECPKFSKKYKENGRVSDYCFFCSVRRQTIGKPRVFRHLKKITRRFNKEVRNSVLSVFETMMEEPHPFAFENKADIISSIRSCFAIWGLDHNGNLEIE